MGKTKSSKKKTPREFVTLACQAENKGKKCAERNYVVSKNKRNTPDRLELKKYCKHCKKATTHKEVK